MSDITQQARELLAGITPGKWEKTDYGVEVMPEFDLHRFDQMPLRIARTDQAHEDSEFIAAAPQIVARLLDLVEELRKRDDVATGVIAGLTRSRDAALAEERRLRELYHHHLKAERAERVKAHTIETVEQLDALPVRAVVRDADGDIHEMDDCGFWRAPRYPSILNAVVLPARLLYHPERDR